MSRGLEIVRSRYVYRRGGAQLGPCKSCESFTNMLTAVCCSKLPALRALLLFAGAQCAHQPSRRFIQKMGHSPHLQVGRSRSRNAAPATSNVLKITAFGGDPTGQRDSAQAFDAALAAAWAKQGGSSPQNFTDGPDLGGVIIDLEGGQYGISRSIVFPAHGGGNVNIVDGSIRALPSFGPLNNTARDASSFLIVFTHNNSAASSWECQDVRADAASSCQWYTYIRFENLVLDAQLRGGCMKISHSTRITVSSTFVTGFSSIGIWAAQPNEDTVILDSFMGTFDWRSKRCLWSHALRTVGIQFDGPDNLVQNVSRQHSAEHIAKQNRVFFHPVGDNVLHWAWYLLSWCQHHLAGSHLHRHFIRARPCCRPAHRSAVGAERRIHW